ncbi:MAG: LysM peptidoglycan-binding domain-containing protein [Thermoanaerobaculia bacterium]
MTSFRTCLGALAVLTLVAACSSQPSARSPAAPAAPAGAGPANPAHPADAATSGGEASSAPVPPIGSSSATPELASAAAAARNGAAASQGVEEPGSLELQPEDADADAADNDASASEAVAAADPETLLHEAMEAYASAGVAWDRGAIDEALAGLDLAYERMMKIALDPAPGGDAVLSQEKGNLRRLISRRIVEIYASRQTAVGDTGASIPRDMNPDVQREIASFQGRERDFFLDAYRRSGLYRPMIVAQLQEAGLPEQLSWLPLVESGFKERALSSARALGLWQFIASTGYRYGLDRSSWIDERMDPEKATKSALAYLTALHDLFGDWLTALAAYNCGEHNVLRQINNQKVSYLDQFWDLYSRLPSETRRYVPRFLATLAILEDPARYGFELPETLTPVEFETVAIERPAQLEMLDRALALENGTLARLNPELRRNATPRENYQLKVPPGTAPVLTASLESLPRWDPPAVSSVQYESGSHRVRSGDTLSAIATRYRTSVAAIKAANNLRSDRLSLGQRLRIPGRAAASRRDSDAADAPPAGRKAASAPAPLVPLAPVAPVAPTAPSSAPAAGVRHEVRFGDSLWQLASRYGTTVEQIRADNGLTGNALLPGQILVIRPGAAPAQPGGR